MQNLWTSNFAIQKFKDKKYRIIILPVVVYGCETWSLTLRKERRLRLIENRVLRRIFGPKRDEVTGKWRKLHNEFTDMWISPNIIRVIKSQRMRLAKQVARVGKKTGFWWGNPRERNRLLDLGVDGRIT